MVQVTANGRGRETDGLWVHHGKLSVGPPVGGFGASGDMRLNRAEFNNQGALYFGNSTNQYLYFDGTRYNLSGGQLFVPSGLAGNFVPGTVNSALGQYRQVVQWFAGSANAWLETAAQATVTTGGNRLRINASGAVISATAAAIIHIGLGYDGGVVLDGLTSCAIPAANYPTPYGFTGYMQVAAGTHRIATFLYTGTANNTGFWNGAYTTLYVTEEKA